MVRDIAGNTEEEEEIPTVKIMLEKKGRDGDVLTDINMDLFLKTRSVVDVCKH